MPVLQLHDTASGKTRPFQCLNDKEVGIYVCGITVYSDCHIGHARCMLVFDTLVRLLRHLDYRVRFVRNITDVDDKILNRAEKEGFEVTELTSRYIASMHEDFTRLGLLKPDHEPRATENIQPMIDLVRRLFERGYAYVADDNDVFFSVRKDEHYGCLSGKKLDEVLVGARVAVNTSKDDPLDFVLWKRVDEREFGWDSPWGRGRPGWHLECSAMAIKYLGQNFDIHGGGVDLCFPHHENEWAQSRCAGYKGFANTWLHSGFVRIDQEKMSKSLGNVIRIKDLLTRYQPEVLRYLFLSSHYRSEVVFSDAVIYRADQTLRKLYLQFDGRSDYRGSKEGCDSDFLTAFESALCDDINTPKALAVMHELNNTIHKRLLSGYAAAHPLIKTLHYLGSILGLFQMEPADYLRGDDDGQTDRINALVDERWIYRRNQDWAPADQIRKSLAQENIMIQDRPDESIWYRVLPE